MVLLIHLYGKTCYLRLIQKIYKEVYLYLMISFVSPYRFQQLSSLVILLSETVFLK